MRNCYNKKAMRKKEKINLKYNVYQMKSTPQKHVYVKVSIENQHRH
jgi:hypothetical protein